MKKWLLATLGTLFLLPAYAQTNITSPIVSGTWTAAGSPYIIKTDIVIPVNSYLRIEPGVNIQFDGYYQVFVKGNLQVKGRQDNRVRFYANDTIGWYNRSTRAGGWRGIKVYAGSSADSSYFRYCDIRDMKDAPGVWGIPAPTSLVASILNVSYAFQIAVSFIRPAMMPLCLYPPAILRLHWQ